MSLVYLIPKNIPSVSSLIFNCDNFMKSSAEFSQILMGFGVSPLKALLQ
ncbi:hypothetical protein [Streptococcus sp. X13SY08]|nr:hypothetical protein [Streptococcus sp. X13SY08]